MPIIVSKFVRNSFIYLVGGSLNKAMPFFLLPVFTLYLEPKELGKLSMFLVFISVCLAFVGMNMQINISKNFHRVNKNELSKIIGTILLIGFILFLLFFILSVGLYFLKIDYFSTYSVFLLLIPLIAFFKFFVNVNTTILRNEQKAFLFAKYEIGMTFIVMAVTICLLMLLGHGWYSQAIGLVIGGGIATLFSFTYMNKQKYISFLIDRSMIKDIVSVSLPLVPHALGLVIINISDRLFLERMLGLEAVGIYTVGYTFGMVVMIFTDSFMKAWGPWFYKQISNPTKQAKEQIVKYTYYYILSIFILSVVLSFISEVLFNYFINQRYAAAKDLIIWISLGYAIRGVYQIFFPYLVHLNKTNFLAISTFIAAVINLVLNYYLIKLFGMFGAALATMVSFTVSALLVFQYQRKYFYMPWKLWNV